jgi:hypothetical protein
MDLLTVTQEMYQVSKRLERASTEIYKLAKIKAESEAEYAKEKAKETLKLKTEGMSITLIPDVVKGNLHELLLKRDLADAQFTASREMLSAIQTQASLLQSILKYQEVI